MTHGTDTFTLGLSSPCFSTQILRRHGDGMRRYVSLGLGGVSMVTLHDKRP